MLRLEQVTALVLAAGLAIPSYWFFWSMAGGGGYDRRKEQSIPMVLPKKQPNQIPNSSIAPHEP